MKKKVISTLLITSVFVFTVTGCGTASDSIEEQEVFATISAQQFYDNIENDFYKQYINKKITITDLTADGPDYIDYKMGFDIICDNKNELPSDLSGKVSVTGIVSDGDLQNGAILQMKKCSIE